MTFSAPWSPFTMSVLALRLKRRLEKQKEKARALQLKQTQQVKEARALLTKSEASVKSDFESDESNSEFLSSISEDSDDNEEDVGRNMSSVSKKESPIPWQKPRDDTPHPKKPPSQVNGSPNVSEAAAQVAFYPLAWMYPPGYIVPSPYLWAPSWPMVGCYLAPPVMAPGWLVYPHPALPPQPPALASDRRANVSGDNQLHEARDGYKQARIKKVNPRSL